MRENIREEFARLVETIEVLRGPDGCPWDKEQDHDSLKKYAIEETYELVEAIDSGDTDRLEDELGDFVLQAILHAQIANENGHFDIGDVCKRITAKLRRRHPHVFSDVEVDGVGEVLTNWENIKRQEKGYDHRKSALDGIPREMPALMRALKMSKKAARTGFDWPDTQAVLEKMREEVSELEEAVGLGKKEEISEEIGDLLFTIVNLARHENIDPEESLRDMLAKFKHRFGAIEEHAEREGKSISDMTLAEMDEVWEKTKENRVNS